MSLGRPLQTDSYVPSEMTWLSGCFMQGTDGRADPGAGIDDDDVWRVAELVEQQPRHLATGTCRDLPIRGRITPIASHLTAELSFGKARR